jgi:hypothetical protein
MPPVSDIPSGPGLGARSQILGPRHAGEAADGDTDVRAGAIGKHPGISRVPQDSQDQVRRRPSPLDVAVTVLSGNGQVLREPTSPRIRPATQRADCPLIR